MSFLPVYLILLSSTASAGFQHFTPVSSWKSLQSFQTLPICVPGRSGISEEFQNKAQRFRIRLQRRSKIAGITCGVKDSSDQFAALALPINPDPSLSPENVITCLMRGLRWNDIPKQNTGLERCYNFADSMCRAAVGGRSSNAAGVSLENFIAYAMNPVFSKMVNCAGFETEPINVLPGSETRGALATQVPSSYAHNRPHSL